MTGSIKAFGYETDDGVTYGIKRDESAAEATQNGTSLYPAYANGTTRLPCGVKQRYINTVLSTDANIRRRFGVGRLSLYNQIKDGDAIIESSGGLAGGGTYTVVSKRGERSSFLFTTDTGQNDGDNP